MSNSIPALPPSVLVLILFVSLGVCANADAQDPAGLFGTWKITGTHALPAPDCGDTVTNGELRVLQRVTDARSILYQGFVKFSQSYENCEDGVEEVSEALLNVDESRVIVTYENPDWFPDILTLDGDLMEGTDTNGTETEWVKISEPSDDDRAQEVKTSVAQREYDAWADQIRAALLSNGHTESDAEAILWKYFDGQAACQVDTLRAMAAESSLSFYELVNMIDTELAGGITNTRVFFELNQPSYETRTNLCQETLARGLQLNEILGQSMQVTKKDESWTGLEVK